MQTIWAEQALLPSGWAKNVRIDVADTGRISGVKQNAAETGTLVKLLLPAPVNVHSHAFQRAMAGLTERRGPNPNDSFWTWRELMFRFLDRLTPENVQAIAAFVQMEMLEAGYATNVEFHYLHHQQGGVPYDNRAEMSERIAAASKQSGIGLCLLPVHYEFGGCDGRALTAGQIRFKNTAEQYQILHEGAALALKSLPTDTGIGAAPHSLRAVKIHDLKQYNITFPDGPIHMHLAEQTAEVDEVLHHWGARPVEWALEHMGMNERWCLIHCTQMQSHETRQLAQSGAVAGLCPITESSLGDGIFDAINWGQHNGAIAVGSDSNIRISLSEELRTLDYSQRLRDGTRAALATTDRSTGRRMYEEILCGGAQAAQRQSGKLEEGCWADMLTLDTTSPHLWDRAGDTVLDAWIFAGDDRLVSNVWSAGRNVVKDGEHIARPQIITAYQRAMKALKDVI